MITRVDYMANASLLHRAYHAQFVRPWMKQAILDTIGLDALLSSTDRYLNDIPLDKWDRLVYYDANGKAVVNGRKVWTRKTVWYNKPGWIEDGFSLGTGVCILKEAARQIIEAAK
mgnify:CR=1 FL=1